jgi:protein-disulfide isomerase
MDKRDELQVITVSGACCMPHLARLDQALEKNLQEALNHLGIKASVLKVSLSAVLAGDGVLTTRQREQILSLFQKRGATFTPAVLINDQVRFAGKPPTPEQLEEALQSVVSPEA